MRKTFFILIAIACCLVGSNASAQTQADNLKARAQEALDKKEYTKAKRILMHDYNSFAANAQCQKAVECRTRVAARYYREDYYKEGCGILRAAGQLTIACEQKDHKQLPELRYTTAKVRLQMYTKVKKGANSK